MNSLARSARSVCPVDWLRAFWPKKVRALLLGFAFLGIVATSPRANAQGLPITRDTEIENLLNDYARPIFKTAGLGTSRVAVRIVRNDSLNAFVIDGRNIFIHTGALLQAQTPNQVIGIFAQQAGHVAGGHMAALRARIKKDQTQALLKEILGIGTTIGATQKDKTGPVGHSIAKDNEIVMRALAAERRDQTLAADQAAIRFLNATQQSGRGMLEVLGAGFTTQGNDEADQDRISRLRTLAEKSEYSNGKDAPELQLRHDLMRAKLSGYLDRPGVVMNRYPLSDKSLPARYARALAIYFQGGQGSFGKALTEVDDLIREKPDNPYFHEVKGDLYMRSGRMKEAIPSLRQALKLSPEASLIRVQLATALQKGGGSAEFAESVDLSRKSLIDDQNPRAYRLLANAYYKQGKGADADAMQAQAYFHEGDIKQAKIFAKRAQPKLQQGAPAWMQMDDIMSHMGGD